MTTETQPLYGGWRRSKSMGIATLNTPQTVIFVASALAPLLVIILGGSLATLPVTIPVALTVIALTVWQRHGMPLMSYVLGRARWSLANMRGETSYRSVFLPAPEALDLPGMVAPTKLVRAESTDGRGTTGLVWNQRTGTMTATLLLNPAGSLLASGTTVKAQVNAWGDTLARLADEDGVRTAAVTLQITPSSGAALSDHVRGRVDSTAPQLARQTIGELVARAPRASAQLAAWMSLVIDPAAAPEKPKGPAEAAAFTLGALDAVDLSGAGVDVLRRATDADIKRLVRGAFSPADMDAPAAEIDELVWHEVGPVAAEDNWTEYQHDGHYSASWVLREAPRKAVSYDVLLKLLAPGAFMRRVTLVYRVLPTHEAQAVVEREINANEARAQYRQRTKRTSTRRERVDAEHAERTAVEEAMGAGMVQWSIYVTTTVDNAADLPAARREVEKAARSSGGLRFRPAFGGQSAAMVVGLPVGINPLL
ncbi:SCO6880 family protein [Streptomyces lavendulocolor]|uniref:SCO6880 family protein n=1 Tax=Streptomyces lavendulocolor TaxID=67316 RepID=A0ABV2WGC7_9ACTN